MKGKINAKTIIVMIILILVIVLGLLGVNTVRTYMSSAASGVEPQNVLAKPDESGKSALITWVTEKDSMGIVEYGTTPASLLLRAVESSATSQHNVALSPLKNDTNYYFRIRVGDEIFDNNGIPYSFKTKSLKADTALVPTPGITLSPTVAAIPDANTGSTSTQSTCNQTTDYNNDGLVNSMDYLQCVKNGGSTATGSADLSPTPTSSSDECTNIDYNSDGIINSLDRLKCLQDKR